MDSRFTPHNMHLRDLDIFREHDPHLQALAEQVYVYRAPLLDELPRDIPGIYTICGGRQIGKSTLLKQWMLALLDDGVSSSQIVFFSGEMINDQHALYKILTHQLEQMPKDQLLYVLIDEITYISDWDKGVKYLADAGFLRQVVLVLTGSDSVILQEARMRFPGRRGKADKVNFHLYTLSFKEYLHLVGHSSDNYSLDELYGRFQNYLIHGGYLTAINEFEKTGSIRISTLDTYAEWIRGDMLKRGRSEHFLREIIQATIKRYGSQISWVNLAKDLSIDHPKTVAEYVDSLASMDAVFVQQALMEDKLVAAPKKQKKLLFTDPFIYHALHYWVSPVDNPFHNHIQQAICDSKISSTLVESVVVAHIKRHFPTYYIKAEGEVMLLMWRKTHSFQLRSSGQSNFVVMI